jgi:tripartite-type tricarboxylate transporter receptor subunit TctC
LTIRGALVEMRAMRPEQSGAAASAGFSGRAPISPDQGGLKMKLTLNWAMRSAIGAIPLAFALAFAPVDARAQEYPTKEIQILCAFPAGSGADVLVRYFADKLKDFAKQPVIVVNKPGAAGNIAAEFVVRSEPDAYTIYIHAGSATAANMSLYKKPPFDAVKDLQVVATLNKQAFMAVVPTKSPYKSMRELTAAMKAKGSKATYAQSNTSGQVIGALYKNITGIEAVEVPFRTANDSVNEFLSGTLDYGMMDPVFALSQAREGRVRILAVSTPERMKATPEIPTMTEEGIPGLELISWFAAMVPAKTPRPIVDKLNAWFNEILKTDETRAYLAKFGGDPFISTPEQAQALLAKQVKDWEGYVKIAKIEPQ